MRAFPKNTPHTDRIGVNKQKKVIRSMIGKHGLTCLCKRKMNPEQVFNKGMWIYHHCIYCGFDYNYQKILRTVDTNRNSSHHVI